MKKSGTCPKCAGRRIGHIAEVPDVGVPYNPSPRSLGQRDVSPRIFSERWVGAYVEAFVCADCGFFEEYVKTPSTVEWDKLPGFRWLETGESGPFR